MNAWERILLGLAEAALKEAALAVVPDRKRFVRMSSALPPVSFKVDPPSPSVGVRGEPIISLVQNPDGTWTLPERRTR